MNKRIVFLFLLILLLVDCKRQRFNMDITDCDPIANHYDDGVHYIKRDLVKDEEGVIDYKKLFDATKPANSECHPTKISK